LWLVGPTASGQLQFATGVRVQLGLAWLFGEVVLDEPRTPIEWLELSVAPSYVVKLTTRFELDIGLRAAAAVVNASDVVAVDDIPGQRQSWSARVLGHAGLEAKLYRDLRLSIEPSIGLLLRAIPIESQAGVRDRLGGLWLGGSLGLIFDPAAPPRPAAPAGR
jgi:hypothetical protein